MFVLTGKTALVTGATQGIGLAIATLLAKQGAKVYVNGVSTLEKCENACRAIGAGAFPALADISTAEGARRLYEITGDVDILVLNASITKILGMLSTRRSSTSRWTATSKAPIF